MGKKRFKSDGLYLCSNNAVDVTGSCIYLRFRGKQILLEFGLVQENDYLLNHKMNNEKLKFDPREIDYVFINHVHADHCAALPRLAKLGFKGKVITTHATAMLMKPMLLNSAFILQGEATILSKKYQRNYESTYLEEHVYQILEQVYEYDDIHKIYRLDDTVSFEWLENSHCLGSRQLRLSLTDENGVTQHILYTSDIGALNTENNYLNNTEIDTRGYKYAIMESTYGLKSRENKKTRAFDLEHLRVAIDTVLERGGSVLLPCFSFSRSQQILTNLYELYHDKNFKYDIIVDSKLTCEISELYSQILKDENLDLWNNVKNWKNVKFVSEKDESVAIVKDHRPKIIIGSSGFCTAGRILSYLHEYLSDDKSMVIFSGYTGDNNSYLSYRIKNYKENKILKISGDYVDNNADCISLTTFSSHANRKDLLEFGSSLNTEKLILVHGSPEAKNSLKEDMANEISKKNKSFKVVAASKDMFLHL